jgi:hypothetical protein
MRKIWTNPQTKAKIEVVVVSEYQSDGAMFLVHKTTATSAKFVFGVRASDCE